MKRILATATALFALVSSSMAADGRYELRVEYKGNVYAVDYGLSGDDCITALDQFRLKRNRLIEINGREFVMVADNAPAFCVAE